MAAAAPADKAEGQVIRRVSAAPLEANKAASVPAIRPSLTRPHTSQPDAGNEETFPAGRAQKLVGIVHLVVPGF